MGCLELVPGWTAISGSAIELWNNLIGVDATNGQNFGELDYLGRQDGFYQDVKTVAGQKYDLSFDARSRPGFTSATTSMDVLWNGSLVATVPPGDSWQNYDFTVVGTGGQDRLTFREVAGQGSDGLGALYDNVALVAKPATHLGFHGVRRRSVNQSDETVRRHESCRYQFRRKHCGYRHID